MYTERREKKKKKKMVDRRSMLSNQFERANKLYYTILPQRYIYIACHAVSLLMKK